MDKCNSTLSSIFTRLIDQLHIHHSLHTNSIDFTTEIYTHVCHPFDVLHTSIILSLVNNNGFICIPSKCSKEKYRYPFFFHASREMIEKKHSINRLKCFRLIIELMKKKVIGLYLSRIQSRESIHTHIYVRDKFMYMRR